MSEFYSEAEARELIRQSVIDDAHAIEAMSPTGRIDSPVSCKKCNRALFIDADGEWDHVPLSELQGEPSDAQVMAAIQVFYNAPGVTDWVDETKEDMRAALRAALTVGEVR